MGLVFMSEMDFERRKKTVPSYYFQSNLFDPCGADLQFRNLGDGVDVLLILQSLGNDNVHHTVEQRHVGTGLDLQEHISLPTQGDPAGFCHNDLGTFPLGLTDERADVRFVPIRNWHQALYMCILYDKWLEPPVWDFVELLVKSIRESEGIPL